MELCLILLTLDKYQTFFMLNFPNRRKLLRDEITIILPRETETKGGK
jgi:hypothetical protein